ncbi:hypothetical protein LUW74_44620 [Actinomadura madurae]|uniref:hypothetical protein n=1 Tax=Actinomadura madurae TaxID=1993 RepID=UPI002026D6B7|nr:hypothetical protein [Actinomadura madurae]URN09743.1 hypothetical protein LUW74_44620 [Actinomadura madurae]
MGVLMMSAAGLLTGCGALNEEDPVAATTPSSPAPEEAAQPSETEQSNSQATQPGSRLKFGQRAVVPFDYGSKKGAIGITVTAIERGDQSAFLRRFGSRAKGLTPYYIRYRIENVGGTDLSFSTAPSLTALDRDGRGTGVVLVGELPDCERGEAGAEFTKAGATFQGCRLQAGRGGTQVTSAEYSDTEGGYSDRPIVWER